MFPLFCKVHDRMFRKYANQPGCRATPDCWRVDINMVCRKLRVRYSSFLMFGLSFRTSLRLFLNYFRVNHLVWVDV